MQLKRISLISMGLLSLVFNLSTQAAMLPFKNVIWIWLENTSFEKMSQQSFIKNLVQNERFVQFSDYSSVAANTQGNVLGMIAGTDLKVKDNAVATFFTPTLVDLMEAKKIPWRVYAEDYPGACYLGSGNPTYQRYRNPFISLARVQKDRFLCGRIMSFRGLDHDLTDASQPRVSIVIPNLENSGGNTDAETAAVTLEKILGPLMKADPTWSKHTVIISTTSMMEGKGPMYLGVMGHGVPDSAVGKTITTPINHFHLLRTLEEGLRVGHLNQNDAKVAPIDYTVNVRDSELR